MGHLAERGISRRNACGLDGKAGKKLMEEVNQRRLKCGMDCGKLERVITVWGRDYERLFRSFHYILQ